MQSPFNRIRAEVINRLQSSIKHHQSNEKISNELLRDLSLRLTLVEDKSVRKAVINQWYKDLLSADIVRKHNLQYQKPILRKELSLALNSLTVNFKKQFQVYF